MEFVLNDGSIMKKLKAKELIKIPIWKGNRVIDLDHVNKIQTSIGKDFEKLKKLDNGYKIVSIKEKDASDKDIIEYYIVDGQHRLKVLQNFYETNKDIEDFDIVVIQKEVKSETEIINYFNEINFAKPILWKTDPSMIVNMYIEALEGEFNKGKKEKDCLIRKKRTMRPYIQVDDLRLKLLEIVEKLSTEKKEIEKFIEKAKTMNTRRLEFSGIAFATCKKEDEKIISSGIDKKFLLGIDKEFGWIHECI